MNALLLERTAGLVSVRVTFVGPDRRAEGFAVPRLGRPERVALVLPTLRCGGAVIRIHGCHVAV